MLSSFLTHRSLSPVILGLLGSLPLLTELGGGPAEPAVPAVPAATPNALAPLA